MCLGSRQSIVWFNLYFLYYLQLSEIYKIPKNCNQFLHKKNFFKVIFIQEQALILYVFDSSNNSKNKFIQNTNQTGLLIKMLLKLYEQTLTKKRNPQFHEIIQNITYRRVKRKL